MKPLQRVSYNIGPPVSHADSPLARCVDNEDGLALGLALRIRQHRALNLTVLGAHKVKLLATGQSRLEVVEALGLDVIWDGLVAEHA